MTDNHDQENDAGSLSRRTGSLVSVGVPGFEPGASASRTLRANQAAPHPVEPGKCSDCPRAASVEFGRAAYRLEHGRREIGAAHEQVGHIRVGPVVYEWRAVES